ncbi:6-hydroxymethylpterin diphosphokinase MptE-like protein [Coraliomargarita algicola]|uniref:6-hydroxymethylpterin diphosphokinase MptE-like protein n=1 Tax=Coraliomargarita algicola TaxID=3092156 RepID=A0ABZ0RGP7_9BACT|nr:6-hydroxymethylpterin diphosphokinase MptE-like protein [Coraliomargarita sp. J2-16]WPJ94698.1 6-hydroxymethylpterin diphosphokinase MptE-like protein [Coraliomargarita sp. J2-16]
MNFAPTQILQRKTQYLRKISGLVAVNTLPLSRNLQRLKLLDNHHQGQKAVIIGMGPSLQTADLERLRNFTTFACNKIYLCFPETNWRPDYYSVNDVHVARNNQEEILNADFGKNCQTLHSCIVANELGSHQNPIVYHYFRNFKHLQAQPKPGFTKSLQMGIRSGGCSICIDQIQLAYLMGFTEVYLIGIDFSFDVKPQTITEESESGKVLKAAGEQNHFHKNYRKPGEKWTVPKLEEQRQAFAQCRSIFEASGRKLLNASRHSQLDALEQVDFDQIFK